MCFSVRVCVCVCLRACVCVCVCERERERERERGTERGRDRETETERDCLSVSLLLSNFVPLDVAAVRWESLLIQSTAMQHGQITTINGSTL